MPRQYERRFDWDEARRRHKAGESIAAIARALGVSWSAVQRAVNPSAKRILDERSRRWITSGRCPDCGTQTTRRAGGASARCVTCAALRSATSVREDTLRCQKCREWKPDDDFTMGGNRSRRGRSRTCRSCQTSLKREYRARHQVPCVHGCGRTVYTKERRDPLKPPVCRPCAIRRTPSADTREVVVPAS